MSRHSNDGDWEPGDYIAGHVGHVDADGRGRIGDSQSEVRTRREASEGDYFFGEIVEVTDDAVVAKQAGRPTTTDATVWVQQSGDTNSTVSGTWDELLRTTDPPKHCNLFTEVPTPEDVVVNKPDVPKEAPSGAWQTVNSVIDVLVGLIVIIVGGGAIVALLSDTVLATWRAAFAESPAMLLPFFLGVSLAYAGILVFEKLIYLSGAFVFG